MGPIQEEFSGFSFVFEESSPPFFSFLFLNKLNLGQSAVYVESLAEAPSEHAWNGPGLSRASAIEAALASSQTER